MVSLPMAYNASPDPLTLGYKLKWGETTSGVYDSPGSPKDVGNVLSGTVEVSGNGPVFVVVVAYSALGDGPNSPEIQIRAVTPRSAVRGA